MPFERLRLTYKQLGALDGSLYYLSLLLDKGSLGHIRLVRYYLVAQPIHGEAACRPATKNPVIELTPDDPLIPHFPRPPDVIARRIRDKAQCFVARSGDEFTGFLWLAYGAYNEDEVRCRYELVDASTCVWDYDVHVEPKHRIGRTFARLWDAANSHLHKRGIRWSMSRISAYNPTSLAAHGRLGIHTLCSATFLCIGPLQISFIGMPPWIHLSFSAASRPTVRLAPPRHGQ